MLKTGAYILYIANYIGTIRTYKKFKIYDRFNAFLLSLNSIQAVRNTPGITRIT